MYPSIRKLPLLGVMYADLYRRTMIQAAVLEALTKEYEMAKVQEAKEIPTVKVLDAADIPDKKSFPPRAVIIALGTFLGLVLAVTRASLPKFSRNGSNGSSNGHWPWAWWKKAEEPSDTKHEGDKPDTQ
jgi:uncharacterized protein involved in exopolysaccharide biosynthesis